MKPLVITTDYLEKLGASDTCRHLRLFAETFPDGAELTPENWKIAEDAGLDLEWFLGTLDRPLPEVEPLIAKNAYRSYIYALYVLRGPFKLGEKEISTDAYCAYLYADNVLQGPFKLGEKAISASAYYWDLYKRHVLKEVEE